MFKNFFFEILILYNKKTNVMKKKNINVTKTITNTIRHKTVIKNVSSRKKSNLSFKITLKMLACQKIAYKNVVRK